MYSLSALPTPPESQRKRKPTRPLHMLDDDDSNGFIDVYELLERVGRTPQRLSIPTARETRKDAEVVSPEKGHDRSSGHTTLKHTKKRVRFEDQNSAEKSRPEPKATQLFRRVPNRSLQRDNLEMASGPGSADEPPILQAMPMPAEIADASGHRGHNLPVTEQGLRNVQATFTERKRQNDELFKQALSERWPKERRQDIKAKRDEILERLRAIKTIMCIWGWHQSLLTQRGELAREIAQLYDQNFDSEKSEAELDSFDTQIDLHGKEFLRAISAAGLAELCLGSGTVAVTLSRSAAMQDRYQSSDIEGAATRQPCWNGGFVTAKAVLQGQPDGSGMCK